MLKNFIRDMATYLPSKFLPAVIGLITAPIMTRLLLPAEFGNWALATGVSDFLFALACSGIGAGAIRFFATYKAKSELAVFFVSLITTTGFVIAIASTISFIILFLLRTYLPDTLYLLLLISVLIFMVQGFFAVFAEVVRAQNRSGFYTTINLIVNYGGLGLGLVLVVVFGLRVDGLMLGMLITLILVLPFLLRSIIHGVDISLRFFRISDILTLWHYAWPLALGNMALWGLRLSDRFVIGFFHSQTEVGLYSAIYNISDKTINMLVALFLLSMGPIVMNTWESQGQEATEETLAMITRLFVIICFPVTVGLTLLAVPFVTVLTGDAYHEGYRIVGYVAFSTFIWGLCMIAGWALLIARKTRQYAINQILAAVVNILLNFLLVPVYGFVAAGITTLIGYMFLLLLQVYTSRSYLTWRFPKGTLVNVSIASIFIGIAVFGVNTIDIQGRSANFVHLFLGTFVGAFIYFCVLWFLGEINDSEKSVVKRFCYNFVRRST